FAEHPESVAQERSVPITMTCGLTNGLAVLNSILATSVEREEDPPLKDRLDRHALSAHPSTDAQPSLDVLLTRGPHGLRPTASQYEGEARIDSLRKTGLKAFEDIEDISIVAAPGSTFGYATGYANEALTIAQLLIGHCERMRYRIAVLDCGPGQTVAD